MHYAQLLFPDFSLIVCGFLVCRYSALNRKVWEQVDSLIYYFLFPVFLFHSIVRSPLDLSAASSMILAAWLMVICSMLLSYAIAYLPGVDTHDHASAAQVAFRFNVYIALALADRLAGREGLLLMAVIVGVCVPLCNMGAVWPMAKNTQQGFAKTLLRNPLVIATLAGLLANVLGFSMPILLDPTATRIGQACLALGLMAAGAGLQLGQVFNSASKRITGVLVLTLRHLLNPLIAFVLIHLFHLTGAQAIMLLVFSAMPTASSCYVLAVKMGYNGAFAAGLVTLSTVLGLFSLPFALEFLR